MVTNRTTIFLENCLGIVNEKRINFIEKKIGIKVPESFLELIKHCDGGVPTACDFEYFNSSFQDKWGAGIGCFLSLNESEFSDFLKTFLYPPEFFPEGLIAFAETGNGDYICFDYREGKDNPDPLVVYWSHEADVGKDISFIAKNFEEFLSMLKEPEV